MLQNWFIMLPELAFVAFFILAAMVKRWRTTLTAKTFFTLFKVFWIFILLATIIFYNISAFPNWFENTSFTSLFKVALYLVAFAWFYLSFKWFLNKNRSSFGFYEVAAAGLLVSELLISARNFAAVALLFPLMCLLIHRLILFHWDEDRVTETAKLYGIFSLLFCMLMWLGCGILYQKIGSLQFGDVSKYLSGLKSLEWPLGLAIGCLFACLLFLLGLAPFHFCFVGVVRESILPVSGYISMLPPFAVIACLLTWEKEVFPASIEFIQPILLAFSCVSVVVGALSANCEKNIRGLFAFSSVYHLGFLVLALSSFNVSGTVSAFVYLLIYSLAMFGIYTVLIGLRNRGNYLYQVEEVSGLSETRPYMAAALLVFMVSLMGCPPLVGFLGRLSIINGLAVSEHWGAVVFLLVSVLFMANAYLHIIRVTYFNAPQNSFDRTDKSIYICLFVCLVLVWVSMINPSYLLQDAVSVLKGNS